MLHEEREIACNSKDGEYVREKREKTLVISYKYICVHASFILLLMIIQTMSCMSFVA